MAKISLHHGDITTLEVDAVVNAANNNLLRGQGLCGAIFEAAGPELEAACRALKYCETGDAVATAGYQLKARHIIHAVGPRYFLNPDESPSLLESAYLNCIKAAKKLQARRIALPCISTGIYGYPKFPAAKIAVKVAQGHLNDQDIEEIIFCCYDEESHSIYKRLLAQNVY